MHYIGCAWKELASSQETRVAVGCLAGNANETGRIKSHSVTAGNGFKLVDVLSSSAREVPPS